MGDFYEDRIKASVKNKSQHPSPHYQPAQKLLFAEINSHSGRQIKKNSANLKRLRQQITVADSAESRLMGIRLFLDFGRLIAFTSQYRS